MFKKINFFYSDCSRIFWKVGVLFTAIFCFTVSNVYAASDTIILARGGDSTTMDLHKTSRSVDYQVMDSIYGNLMALDLDGNVSPNYAESMTVSDDGLTYRFSMREGLKCHDGTPFDAAAVKWNFDRATDPEIANPMASRYGDIAESYVEGNVYVLKLKSAFSALPAYAGEMPIMCPSSIQGDEVTPIGAGPWKFVSWDRGNEIILERNEDYVNYNPLVKNPGPPYMKRLIWKVIPEATARMAALKAGEVTFIEPSLPDAAALINSSEFKMDTAPLSAQKPYLGFTTGIAPFNDVRARKAIAHVINRQQIADIAFEGLVKPNYCPISPGLFGHNEEFCKKHAPEYDPEKAKSLLAELGYNSSNPLEIILQTGVSDGWGKTLEVVQQQLKDIGVKSSIEYTGWGEFRTSIQKRNLATEGTPVVWMGGMSGVDPDYVVFLWTFPGGPQNQGIDNADLQQLLLDQRTTTGAARLEVLNEIQKFLLENVYEVLLVSPGWSFLTLYKSNVEGFQRKHAVIPVFNDVKIN